MIILTILTTDFLNEKQFGKGTNRLLTNKLQKNFNQLTSFALVVNFTSWLQFM